MKSWIHYKSYSILCLLLCAACSIPPSHYEPLFESQPYVVNLSPTPYKMLDKLETIEISFSKPIDENSLKKEEALFVLTGEVQKENLKKDTLTKIKGKLQLSNNFQKITWQPDNPLTGGNYTLVITSSLESENHVPFNQSPGEDSSPFLAIFKLPSSSSANPSQSDANHPSAPSLPLHRPQQLIIHEVLYDASGSDTDGNEFIELYGTPHADLQGYQVIIVNGDNGEILKNITLPLEAQIRENGLFVIADAKTNQSHSSNIENADFIDNFDPQNGPDSIQLIDDQGHLLDALAYGNIGPAQAQNGLAVGEGSPAIDVSAGHSLSRINGEDRNDNFTDFIEFETPSPGAL